MAAVGTGAGCPARRHPQAGAGHDERSRTRAGRARRERVDGRNVAGTLGPNAYRALWLRYAEEMPVKDIARAMGKTQVGVRALLHRSRMKLAKKLKAPQQLAAAAETVLAERKYSIL